jgi:hypothetical protein
MTKLSVVIPVLNEETLIQELIDRVTLNCEKITNDYEVMIFTKNPKKATMSFLSREKIDLKKSIIALCKRYSIGF